jgi:hypothetical protein
MSNFDLSPSFDFPPDTTPEQKERVYKAERLGYRLQSTVALGLYLLALEDRISELEKALHEKGH